jgi:RNase H-fold protein (predicted Holliday junction resolvase)
VTAEGFVLGVDPGSAKVGYALADAAGTIVTAGIAGVAGFRDIVVALAREHPIVALALGRGTKASVLLAQLDGLEIPVHLVDEFETSRLARELYFREHPPRGWRRLVPMGMLLPPRPIDDYAAILIARRFLTRGRRAAPAN